MAALKRKQNWPLAVDKDKRVLMQTSSGQLQMLGYCENMWGKQMLSRN